MSWLGGLILMHRNAGRLSGRQRTSVSQPSIFAASVHNKKQSYLVHTFYRRRDQARQHRRL